MGFITAIGTALPANRFAQSTLSEFMVRAMQLDYEKSRKLKTIFRSSGISFRHSVLDDYGKEQGFTFYSNTKNFEPFPSTEKRQTEFKKHALSLSVQAIQDCTKQRKGFDWHSITHLITVSCTGMYAPGLDIELVKELGLRTDVERVAINFMGCYAALNAIKTGEGFCNGRDDAVILIVCTEMCSLHFQKEASDDNLLANGLFADGAAALLLEKKPIKGWNLSTIASHNALHFTNQQHMAWGIGNFGFEMKLSSYVPGIIRGGIKKLTTEMLEKINKKIHEIKHFAIHPGGKKILEVIENELDITREQNQPAYHVLNNFGNMSSPTVLFVLNEIFKNLQPSDHNSSILSFAFGPGLTLESILFNAQFI
ncbi:MAG TPA: type III polyketide synthase [Cyclobacteriaceae bacterium]|nr:type III polyketide synthase [Cyclobacteriaceae bacterium]